MPVELIAALSVVLVVVGVCGIVVPVLPGSIAILGGLLVIEVMSVILQTGFFKLTRRITGTPQRLFKMTPIHHHFELLGWAQVTIVMRFWIIAGLCVAAGLGIFYAEWVAGT